MTWDKTDTADTVRCVNDQVQSLPECPRQAYALAHPISEPAAAAAGAYSATRAHARGFLLMSILAVDR